MINTQLDGSGKIICVPTICLATIKTFIKMNKNISSPINNVCSRHGHPSTVGHFGDGWAGEAGFVIQIRANFVIVIICCLCRSL